MAEKPLTSKDPLWLRNAMRGLELQRMGSEITLNAVNNLRCTNWVSSAETVGRCTRDKHHHSVPCEVNEDHKIK